MAKYSKLDPLQMQRIAFDEDTGANRVTMVNTELAIEISAADGDSAIAVPMSETLAAGVHSIIGMKSLCRYGEVVISVSPLDTGDLFYTITTTELEPKSICARRIKIEGAGLVVVQSV